MALRKEKTEEIVKKFARDEKDTGSPEVQIALLTEKINALSKHLQSHRQDKNSKHGLDKMIGKRRSLLNYLLENDVKKYRAVINDLGLRR